jgi:hypothetical protein
MPEMADRFKSDYDEYIIKRVASIFGVSPSSLGVVARAGLGGGKGAFEGEQENVETVSTKPMEDYVVGCINSLSRRYLNASKNVTFVLNDLKSSLDERQRAQALQVSLFSGQKTLNDVQGELGQNLYDMPEADEPFIVAGNTVLFLKGMLNVNEAGETTGQAGEPSDGKEKENTEIQVSQSGSQTDISESQAPKASVGKDIPAVGAPADQKSAMTEELKDFGRFVKSRHKRGNWRAFDFTTFDAELADNLNEQAYFIVKGATPMPENIYEWASNIVNSEITDTPKGSLTKRGSVNDLPGKQGKSKIENKYRALIAAAIAAGFIGVEKAIQEALAAMPTMGADISALRIIAEQAIQHNVTISSGELGSTIGALQSEASTLGLTNAANAINLPPIQVGTKLQGILDQADADAQAIQGTTLSRIVDAITNGMASNASQSEISNSINSLINDPARADMIAVTETNRAYNAAVIDSYQAAGLTTWTWVTYEGACDICLSEEGEHTIGDAYPPAHPNCQCTVPDPTTSTGE